MRSTSWILMFVFLFMAGTIFFAGPESVAYSHESAMDCLTCHHTSPLHDLAVEGQGSGRFVITH